MVLRHINIMTAKGIRRGYTYMGEYIRENSSLRVS